MAQTNEEDLKRFINFDKMAKQLIEDMKVLSEVPKEIAQIYLVRAFKLGQEYSSQWWEQQDKDKEWIKREEQKFNGISTVE